MTQPVTLASLTTMRIGGPVKHFARVASEEELGKAIADAKSAHLPFFVIGGGSNIIATDYGYNGVIIKNEIMGFSINQEDDQSVTFTLGAGENWDQTVERTVKMGLSGIEAMSAIPGTVGATPVQNVGAYGQEIADTLISLKAFDTRNDTWVELKAEECGFGYRTSRFKNLETRHHIITSITIKLSKSPMKPPFYASLAHYLEAHGISDASPATIRDAVVMIRRIKLPDPKKIPNAGSFFKNPIVSPRKAQRLLSTYPHMPTFEMQDGRVKLAAGWLIEQAGLKGYTSHAFKTYEHNALVVVNLSSTSYIDLAAFRKHIVYNVVKKFEVELEQEPELLLST